MFFLVFLTLLSVCKAEEWAVLVASSNTWGNYRHQSDVCHAYQVANKNGIPDERIIVFQYDDLAQNIKNPFPGQVFNAPTPTGVAGIDIYKNCKKDYTGTNVTAATFLAVITGDAAAAGGKVLESTADDHVFINMVDHGATGILAFATGPYLTVADLSAALQTMVDKKMFAQLTFYLEACEAGSMFAGLANNESIYVTTAANAVESSWGTYCPPDDYVDGVHLGTCLGDLYSVSWMEDCDTQKMGLTETLQAQFEKVQLETNKSHVMQYGDLSFTDEEVSQFLGDKPIHTASDAAKSAKSNIPRSREMGTVRSRDIPLHLAYYRYLRTDYSDLLARHSAAAELKRLLEAQVNADDLFLQLSIRISGGTDAFYSQSQLTPCGQCCSKSFEAFQQLCGGFDDYSFQYARVVTNLCQRGYPESAIIAAFKTMCNA